MQCSVRKDAVNDAVDNAVGRAVHNAVEPVADFQCTTYPSYSNEVDLLCSGCLL